jgi:hypothetical protein
MNQIKGVISSRLIVSTCASAILATSAASQTDGEPES